MVVSRFKASGLFFFQVICICIYVYMYINIYIERKRHVYSVRDTCICAWVHKKDI